MYTLPSTEEENTSSWIGAPWDFAPCLRERHLALLMTIQGVKSSAPVLVTFRVPTPLHAKEKGSVLTSHGYVHRFYSGEARHSHTVHIFKKCGISFSFGTHTCLVYTHVHTHSHTHTHTKSAKVNKTEILFSESRKHCYVGCVVDNMGDTLPTIWHTPHIAVVYEDNNMPMYDAVMQEY